MAQVPVTEDGPPVIDHTEAEGDVPLSHCGHRHTYGHCVEIRYD